MKTLALPALLLTAALAVAACSFERGDVVSSVDGDGSVVTTSSVAIVPPGKPTVGERYDFSLVSMDGEELSCDTLAGKVVVLDFWATWCGPCVKELPHLRELYAEYADDGLEIVGLSFDRSRNRLTKFLGANDVPWPQVFLTEAQQRQVGENTGVTSIPRLFVLDRDGKLVTTQGRGRLDAIIPDLLSAGV